MMKFLTPTRITLFLALGYLLALLAGATFPATAQIAEAEWTMPVNLSQSGAATEPRLVTDQAGQLHALWLDAVDGVTYAHTTEGGWSDPQRLTFPFPQNVPLLLPDGDQSWHAFWRDAENSLFYSRSEVGDLTDAEAWSAPQQLTISVLAFDALINQEGRLQLAYVKSVMVEENEEEPVEEEPAGVYYRSSEDRGETWSEPTSLYNSLYFRLLEVEQAHVQIATTNNSLYTVWDDTPGERVLSRRSPDGGQTWEEIRQVDGREELDRADSTSPSQIRVVTNGQTVYLYWQAGHEGITCTQYFQWSDDDGITWQPRQPILQDFPICAENNLLFFHNDLLLLLLTNAENQTYLLAWDGSQWSEPEEQLTLSSFLDPETFRPLALACYQGTRSGDHLVLLGCDAADGGDIWMTSRPVGNLSELFPPPSVWRSPQMISSIEASILAPVSVADAEGRIHLLWSQAQSTTGAESAASAEASIYYARWDGTAWLGPVTVVTSPTGTAQHPSLAIDPSGRLLLVWSGGAAGEIYFSQANADQATTSSAWAEPLLLPAPRLAVTTSDILVDQAGTIVVVYAISLNENRGIYLTKSSDSGRTWSDPVTAFDGVIAEWAIVDRPRLTQTGNGTLSLLWTHYGMPPNLAPLALYYARSDDSGDTWSQPELVAEGPIIWSGTRGLGERTLHRAWQERSSEGAVLRYEYSLDSGTTWSSEAQIIPGLGELVGPAALIVDQFGRLHLLQMTNQTLRHWLWDNDGWLAQEELELDDPALSTAEVLTAAVAADGTLAAIYIGLTLDEATDQMQDTLFFTSRPLDRPDTMPTPLPTLMPTPLPTATVTPMPGPSPTPTTVFSTEVSQETGPLAALFAGGPWAGLILGLIPTGLLILIVFLVGIRFARAGRL